MPHLRRHLSSVLVALILMSPSLALGAGVHALFDLDSPSTGPFPSDRFTVADPTHNTGRRVALPKPNCAVRPSDCSDIDVINTLDGFNPQPRISIPFSGAINPSSVNSTNVFLVRLGSTRPETVPGAGVIGINQVVWHPATNTLHVESDEFLDQHTRYALIVTRGIRDAAGDPVEAGGFATFRHDLNFGHTKNEALKAYRKDLLDALAAAGVLGTDVVAASVFTTQSTTAVLEKIRAQIKAAVPPPAEFGLGPLGAATVFPLNTVTGMVWNQQRTTGPTLTATAVGALLALQVYPGVGAVAFGKYASPDYETSAKFIPPVGTLSGVPVVQATNDVYVNLFLPAGTPPLGGWPVAIFGHGFGDSKNNSPFVVASRMAAHGVATIAINVVGHGRGPLSTLTVNRTAANGGPMTFSAGGRGIDQNGDGVIDTTEGSSAAAPRVIIGSRDGLRQTTVDLMQLTRVVETGGIPGLDPSRIYYFGQSFGGIYGTIFLGVEPSVRLGVPNVPGGAIVDITWMSPVFRPLLGAALHSRTPALDNLPPTVLSPTVTIFNFNENLPLRNQPPVVNTVPGADDIQAVIDDTEWVQQSGNPVAHAPHIRKDPLAGVPAKFVIFQFAKGDQTVPNPTTSAILRAGDLEDTATFYRNDLAFAASPAGTIAKNPHTFLTGVLPPGTRGAAIALEAQEQIAVFFASEIVPGMTPIVIDPDSVGLFTPPVFETPIVLPLPETFSYIP